MTDVATSGTQCFGIGAHVSLGRSRLKGVGGMMTVLLLGMTSQAQVVIIALKTSDTKPFWKDYKLG